MLLSDLLSLSDIELKSEDFGSLFLRNAAANLDVVEIFCDSRKVVTRGLFIAIEGLHTDSHAYISEAVSHGAVAAVVCRAALSDGRVDVGECDVPLIAVEDSREAFARIWAAWYGNPQKKMKFIGVTGTNGKTSVCGMIYDILTRAGHKCGLIGTTGSVSLSERLDIRPESALANMTTPDPPELYRTLDLMQKDGVEYVIAEITSHALALGKVCPIDFQIGIFTNLTEDHLDFHLDMESYFEAKKRLFSRSARAIINIDDKYGRRLAGEIDIPKYTCSAEGRAADFCACEVKRLMPSGVEYKLSSNKMRLRLRSRIPGKVTVMNSMQATVAAYCLGVPPRDVKDSLALFEGVRGRLEKLKIDARVDFSVYVDYAHTPDALENLLSAARSFSRRGQRLVLVFGCGGDREVQKRSAMGRIASLMSDFFVVTSDNSRSEKPSDIIKDILSGVTSEAAYTVIEDRRAAIEYVIKNARRGDVILLAGKGHEEYEIDMRGKRPFSERLLVKEFCEKYYS